MKNPSNSLLYLVSLFLFLFVFLPVSRAEPTLTLQTPHKTITFTQSELLARSRGGESLTVKKDSGYKNKEMTYSAVVPVLDLIRDLKISKDAIIQFKCLDGFSAPLSTELLLADSPKSSRAYIAIEDPIHPWPPLKEGSKATAGPFYLVWKNPELSKVGQEQWPFQLARLEVKPSLRETYPGIFPPQKASVQVERGFKVFTKTCFACHTMNREGESKLGPDLNLPYSPTEYLKEEFLRKLIRNPQNVRHWPESKMAPLPESVISSNDLDDLISYLKSMATRKVKLNSH